MSTKIIIFAIDPNQIKSRNTKNKSNKMEMSNSVYTTCGITFIKYSSVWSLKTI